MSQAKAGKRGTVLSAERALRILCLFREGRHSLAVTQVAAELGVANSTAHRLLRTLCEAGFLHQDPVSKRYELSLLLYTLGNLAVMRSDLYRRAFAPLERLHHVSGEGCHISVADLPDIVYVEHRDSDRTAQFISRMGVRAPANCTSTGKVLLAHAPPGALDDVLDTGLRQMTEHSITDPERLLAELQLVRERGYAQSRDEMELGSASVAAPVRDGAGNVVAAPGLAGRSADMDRLTLDRAVELVLECSAEISELLSPLRRVRAPRSTSFPQGGISS